VPSQFLNHPEAENVALTCMVKNVQTDEARVKVLVICIPVLDHSEYLTSSEPVWP
jgi:hypothetical protein